MKTIKKKVISGIVIAMLCIVTIALVVIVINKNIELKKESEIKQKKPEYSLAYIDVINKYKELHPGGKYDLIYFNDDDIPELVAGVDWYYVSLYTYDAGSVYTLMDDWGYGAGGNQGYEYLPKKNALRNYNTDLAGEIMNETYATLKDGHELESYSISSWSFKDENKNYMIDDGEEQNGRWYYYESSEITPEEYSSYQILGDFDFIIGDKTAAQIISELAEK